MTTRNPVYSLEERNQLIALVSGGDMHVLEKIYDEYGPAVYGQLLKKVGVPEKAQEMLALVFNGLSGSISNWGRESLLAWLLKFANQVTLYEVGGTLGNSSPAAGQDLADFVFEAMYHHGKSAADVAAQLGMDSKEALQLLHQYFKKKQAK